VGRWALAAGCNDTGGLASAELKVARDETEAWAQKARARRRQPPGCGRLRPAAVGPSKRWPKESYAALARKLLADGFGGLDPGRPGVKRLLQPTSPGETQARDLTGDDLRDAILALACAATAVSDDSGVLHVAAALGHAPRSASLARPAPGTGRRSIRSHKRLKRRRSSIAGRAISRSAASSTTAACATSLRAQVIAAVAKDLGGDPTGKKT